MSFNFPIANLTRQRRINPFENIDTSTPNLDALSSHMDEMPNREDYQLGTKDRIINAIVGGMTGFTSGAGKAIDVTRSNYDRPYQQAATDWSLKGRGLSEAADAESRQINSRLRDAQIQERYLENIDDLDQKYAEAEQDRQLKNAEAEALAKWRATQDENADALRRQTAEYQDRMASAAERRADAALANANRKRTGNQGKPTRKFKNYKEAKVAAADKLLAESPAFADYIQVDEDGNVVIRKDATGNYAKRWIDNKGREQLLPMDENAIQVVQNFNIKMRQLAEKLHSSTLEDDEDLDNEDDE